MTESRRRRVAVLLIAAAPGLPACTAMSDSSAAPNPPSSAVPAPAGAAAVSRSTALERTAWLLRALPGRPAPAGATATLAFDGGRVAGSDGCNRYGGPYTATGSTLALGPGLMSTRMACSGPAGELAAAFVPVLSATRGWRIDGTELVLLDAGGAVLATFAPQPTGLAGTHWQVTGYNTGRQAVASVRTGTRPTLSFGAEGALGGSGGCNTYSGSYTVTDGVLRIGPLRTTRMACDREVMQQEAALLAALQAASSVRREADRLELRSADGALQVTATATAR